MKLGKLKIQLEFVLVILLFHSQFIEGCSSSNEQNGENTQDNDEGNDDGNDLSHPDSGDAEGGDSSNDEIIESLNCDLDPDVCAELSPGEHCEDLEKECKCGNNPSCIGTDKPLCHQGKCTGTMHQVVRNHFHEPFWL